MSTIAVGASQTFNLGDGQNLEIATNGGFYSLSLTPNLTGKTTTSVQGPGAHAHTFGPYAGGAVLILTNQTVDTLTVVQPPATLTAAQGVAGGVGVIAADASGNAIKPDGSTLTLTTTAAQINALGLPLSWNATTNTPTLASGTAAAVNAYTVTVAGSTTLDGISTWGVNDIAYFDGTVWRKIAASALGITTSALLKGDGAGAAAAAVAGTDYIVPPLIQQTVPIGIAPAGAVGANGAVTMGTAFVETYSGGIWLWYPANALTGSNAAGLYWTVMSSTTAGQVYNTTYVPGTTSFAKPAAPTAFSGTTGGAYVPSTGSNIAVLQTTIPANYLGKSGTVRARMVHRVNNSATGKRVYTYLGATQIGITQNPTSVTTNPYLGTFWNVGAANVQAGVSTDLASSSTAPQSAAIDTTASQALYVYMLMNATTDWQVLLLTEIAVTPGV